MPRDIYLTDGWETEYASTGDIRTVTGDPQRGQQVATLAFNAARDHLGEGIYQEAIIEMQSEIRDNLDAADAVDRVNSIVITERTDTSITLDISTDVTDVTVPIEFSRP